MTLRSMILKSFLLFIFLFPILSYGDETKIRTRQIDWTGLINGNVDITGIYKVEGEQIDSGDLSDGSDIGMLDENENATGVWTFPDGTKVDGAVKAADSTGVGLKDASGNLGIYVKDGGQVGIGTADTAARLHVTALPAYYPNDAEDVIYIVGADGSNLHAGSDGWMILGNGGVAGAPSNPDGRGGSWTIAAGNGGDNFSGSGGPGGNVTISAGNGGDGNPDGSQGKIYLSNGNVDLTEGFGYLIDGVSIWSYHPTNTPTKTPTITNTPTITGTPTVTDTPTVLPVSRGGTGSTIFEAYGVLYCDDTAWGPISSVPAGMSGQVLGAQSGGSPIWIYIPSFTPTQTPTRTNTPTVTPTRTISNTPTSTPTATILPVSHGGTGAGTFTQYGVLYGNGAGAFGSATGVSGHVLLAESGGAPYFDPLTDAYIPDAITLTGSNCDGVIKARDGTGIGLSDNDGTTLGVYVEDGGDVGIGLSAPSSKLHVSSAAASNYAARFFNDGNNTNAWGVYVQAGEDARAGTSIMMAFADGDGTLEGYIQNNAGTIEIAQVSDANDKKDIEDTKKDALSMLAGLRVKDYRYADNEVVQTGFIAQDVEAVFPDAVTTHRYTAEIPGTATGEANTYEEREVKCVANARLIPILWEQNRLQQERIEALEATVADLATRIGVLEQN